MRSALIVETYFLLSMVNALYNIYRMMETKEGTSAGTEKERIDWNIKARKIYLKRDKDWFRPTGNKLMMKWEGKDFGPDCELRGPDENDLKEFIEKHMVDINHGDLLTVLDEYRATNTIIVYYDEKENKMTTMSNPDDRSAGYLTIPHEVLKNVTRAMEKYANIYSETEYNVVNMHLSPNDDFIKEKLGDKVKFYILVILCRGQAAKGPD